MRRIGIGERPTSRVKLAAWYSAALAAQATSGLGVATYAKRLGISAWTLYQWRRRLAAVTDGAEGRGNLVEVTIAGPGQPACDRSLIVRVNDGRRSIEVPRSFDSDDLRRLVTLLESC